MVAAVDIRETLALTNGVNPIPPKGGHIVPPLRIFEKCEKLGRD